jgi:hypothetical protein
LLAAAFAVCLVGTLALNTWRSFPVQRTVIGFFGFGIPTIAAGAATAALWDGHKALQSLLGWAGTMIGIVCGIAVLLLVGGWVFSDDVAPVVGPLIWRLVAFAVCGFVCGTFGIAMLFQAEAKAG